MTNILCIVKFSLLFKYNYLEKKCFFWDNNYKKCNYRGEIFKKSEFCRKNNILYFDFDFKKGYDYVFLGENEFVGLHNNEPLLLSPKQRKALLKEGGKGLVEGKAEGLAVGNQKRQNRDC